jgi:hypothetical protein
MSNFSLTPASSAGAPPKAPQRFPQFLDIRVNGVSLGEGITVLDFQGPDWDISRGTGENADTVTIALV